MSQVLNNIGSRTEGFVQPFVNLSSFGYILICLAALWWLRGLSRNTGSTFNSTSKDLSYMDLIWKKYELKPEYELELTIMHLEELKRLCSSSYLAKLNEEGSRRTTTKPEYTQSVYKNAIRILKERRRSLKRKQKELQRKVDMAGDPAIGPHVQGIQASFNATIRDWSEKAFQYTKNGIPELIQRGLQCEKPVKSSQEHKENKIYNALNKSKLAIQEHYNHHLVKLLQSDIQADRVRTDKENGEIPGEIPDSGEAPAAGVASNSEEGLPPLPNTGDQHQDEEREDELLPPPPPPEPEEQHPEDEPERDAVESESDGLAEIPTPPGSEFNGEDDWWHVELGEHEQLEPPQGILLADLVRVQQEQIKLTQAQSGLTASLIPLSELLLEIIVELRPLPPGETPVEGEVIGEQAFEEQAVEEQDGSYTCGRHPTIPDPRYNQGPWPRLTRRD